MTFSKTMDLMDYTILDSQIRAFDIGRSHYTGQLEDETIAWGTAIALHATQKLCQTALVIGKDGHILASLLNTLGIQVEYQENYQMLPGAHMYDAIYLMSVLDSVDVPDEWWSYALNNARKLVVAIVDFTNDGAKIRPEHKRTYTAPELRKLHDKAVIRGWYSYHRLEWEDACPIVDGSFTRASLCVEKYTPVPRYDITFFSIMRQAEDYVERYEQQITDALRLFRRGRCVVVEGDSTDSTKQKLGEMREHLFALGHDMEIVPFDTAQPMIGSIDNAGRWKNLERCWNESIWHYKPTEYAVCIESDLIWDVASLEMCLKNVNAGVADVMYPALLTYSKLNWFHDINGFVAKQNGENFTNEPPFVPAGIENNRFIPLLTGGGMIVFKGDLMRYAIWKNKCRLHFPESVKLMADMHTRIFHP